MQRGVKASLIFMLCPLCYNYLIKVRENVKNSEFFFMGYYKSQNIEIDEKSME